MILSELPAVGQNKVAHMLRSLPPDWRPAAISEQRTAAGVVWTVRMVDADGNHAAFFVIELDAAELGPARGQP